MTLNYTFSVELHWISLRAFGLSKSIQQLNLKNGRPSDRHVFSDLIV